MKYKGWFGKWHSSEKQAGIKNLFRYLDSYQGGCIEFIAWTKEPFEGFFSAYDKKARKGTEFPAIFSNLNCDQFSHPIFDGKPSCDENIQVQSAHSILYALCQRESIYSRPGTRGTFGTGYNFDFSKIKFEEKISGTKFFKAVIYP